jgi:putative Mg2+ transporter-C (MgtC) family protein
MDPFSASHNVYITSTVHLLGALFAGGLIGLERSARGRPAGFRTHTLVCMASSLLMLLTIYQVELLPSLPADALRVDPTRMAQGIMTGIGFLGAGVIMKEHFNIRGLTTAASIWITSAIGILIGIGFYFPAALATLLTLGALAIFPRLESMIPTQHYAYLEVRTNGDGGERLTLEQLRAVIKEHRCNATDPSYALMEGGKFFRYQMTIRTRDIENFRQLADSLVKIKKIPEFELRPAGE